MLPFRLTVNPAWGYFLLEKQSVEIPVHSHHAIPSETPILCYYSLPLSPLQFYYSEASTMDLSRITRWPKQWILKNKEQHEARRWEETAHLNADMLEDVRQGATANPRSLFLAAATDRTLLGCLLSELWQRKRNLFLWPWHSALSPTPTSTHTCNWSLMPSAELVCFSFSSVYLSLSWN